MDLDEKRTVKGSASVQPDGVSGMNPVVVQAASEAVSTLEADDARLVAGAKLIECHG